MLVESVKQSKNFNENILMTIRDDLKVKLGGSTLLTLMEIASTCPENTNPTNLCCSLEVPLSTLSTQLRKLIELEYKTQLLKTVIKLLSKE